MGILCLTPAQTESIQGLYLPSFVTELIVQPIKKRCDHLGVLQHERKKEIFSKCIHYAKTSVLMFLLFSPGLITVTVLEKIGIHSILALIGSLIVSFLCFGVLALFGRFF